MLAQIMTTASEEIVRNQWTARANWLYLTAALDPAVVAL